MRIALIALLFGLVRPAAETPMLVSTSWLADHLKDKNLVLIEVGPKEAYDAGHIPGAQYVNLHSLMAGHGEGKDELYLEIPPRQLLDSVLRALGINKDSRIIVYFGAEWVTPAARVYLTLDYAGLRDQSSFLDGGSTMWKAENRAFSTDVPKIQGGNYTSKPRNDVVVNAGFVSTHLHDPSVSIIDARLPGFYLDTIANEMPRGGHIVGAANIPYEDVVDSVTLRLKPRAELTKLFEAAGAKPGNTVVGYCHIGQQASLIYFTARYLGYDARLYDGSFQDWSAHPDWPIEGSNRSVAGN